MTASQIHTLRFDSVSELGRFAQNTPRYSELAQSAKAESQTWDYGMNYDAAIQTAVDGGYWEEGAAMMNKSVKLCHDLQEHRQLPTLATHIQGFMPCVPNFLMGVPNSMFKRPLTDKLDRPVLRIGVNMGVAYGVPAEDLIRKGAAILACIDDLESNGYRCELVALWRASSCNEEPFAKWVNIECVIKQADQHWNPTSAAFMLAHPAAIRRVMWRVAETQPVYDHAINSHYCTNRNTIKLKESMAADFDVWFGCALRESWMQNEKAALEHIEQDFASQLAKLDGAD